MLLPGLEAADDVAAKVVDPPLSALLLEHAPSSNSPAAARQANAVLGRPTITAPH